MRVNMSDVKAFILKQKNTKYDLSSFLCGSTNVWSGDGVTPNSYFTFTLLEDDTYSIKARNPANMPENVVLPSTYKGKPVTVIAEQAFVKFEGDTLEDFTIITGTFVSVFIPASITNIGMIAFGRCDKLQTVTFGEGSNLTTIGEGVFEDCSSLIDITIPTTVTSIGDGAFRRCSSLIDINVPSSVATIAKNAFEGCSNLTIYCEADSQPSGWDAKWNPDSRPVVWGYTYVDDSYFTYTELADGTYSVKAADVNNMPSEVGIPYSYNGKAVTAIAEDAFRNCKTITTVVIPNSITSIGDDAFNGCTNLTEINLPSTVTEIGSGAFFYCTALATIVIPSSVTTIGDDAFAECSALSINCEVTEANKPSGWSEYWNSSNRPVTWGYTG
jgi:hypothetical protein